MPCVLRERERRMSLIVSAVIMGVDGFVYLMLGVCMLFPVRHPWRQRLAQMYPSLFKQFVLLLPMSDEETTLAPVDDHDDGDDDDEPPPGARVSEACVCPVDYLVHDLGYRMLGYLLLVVGLCRGVTCFNWGCGYIYLGLVTCLAEIGMLCNELLRQESMFIHRAMAVLLQNVAVSLLYIGAGVPYCR
jgi:hypothetical protein